ncbi:pyridoxal phosphate-dependent aminotransferase family protein [Chryseobacterium sp.]|uniref:aminotransferase class I/II-fold pyridoxal phosphate-dependent enzyme n=1 Tax=Chryseobacterium sp. TaxID=1871047 RepID=UPI0028982946|nr:pyridoxal phosphate-dependent aminotransferase family protein [Chryseobacterium sp.]
MLNHFLPLEEALEKRKQTGILRTLRAKNEGVDFYSNDYLGFAKNKNFRNLLLKTIQKNPDLLKGSTGSRLISGNTDVVTETEEFIAKEHQYEAAILFSSGYNANLALFASLPTRHDTIIVDEKIHRSVHDGCKMSNAKKIKFRHNDCGHLESILKRQNGTVYIAVESLYSMDGDFCPLQEIAELAEKYQAGLIVDEAHAFGVFGYGLVHRLSIQEKVLATVVTYGKALGTHGAAVLTNDIIKSYLINFASPFIYTTAAHDFLWISISKGYEFLNENKAASVQLQKIISTFRKWNVKSSSDENSPIQSVIIPDNNQLKLLSQTLSDNGFLTYPIFSPTVKEGAERLRICLHSFNTEEEIVKLTELINEFT